MSIEQLSKISGLSMGLISQMERNITTPSVWSLWEVAKALDVRINYFFDEYDKSLPIVKKNSRKTITLPNSNVTYELLSPNLKKKIEFLLVKIEPGMCTSYEQISHEGEECGYVVKGTMKVKWGSKEYVLEEGDSIYLDSNVPHRYINVGEDTVISVWAMTPPSF